MSETPRPKKPFHPATIHPLSQRGTLRAKRNPPRDSGSPLAWLDVLPGVAGIRREIEERIERVPTSLNEYGYDPFGLSKDAAVSFGIFNTLVYRHWLRVEAHGTEHLPADGPVLVVGNHAGNTFAWDAAMVGAACFLEGEPPRLARGLGEFFLPTIPFFNEFMARSGSVVGTPENCAQLFERGECVMVFPEGARGFVKTYANAYELERFGLGFLRMALEHRVPILPVGIVGSEEQSPGLYVSPTLGRLIGAPPVPITLTVPWLGPLGFVPLPVKFRLNFGPLLRFEGDHDAEEGEIQPKVDVVTDEIRRLIRLGLAERRGWFA